jgi:hypothetical protein
MDFDENIERMLEAEIADRKRKCPFRFIKLYLRFVLPGEKIPHPTPEQKEESLKGFLTLEDISGQDDRTDEEKEFDEEFGAVFIEMLNEPDAVQSWRSLIPEENLPFGPYICAIHYTDADRAESEEEPTDDEPDSWVEMIENHVRSIYSWIGTGNLHLPHVTLPIPIELIHEKLQFNQGNYESNGKPRNPLLVNRRDMLVIENTQLRIGYDFIIQKED